MGKIKIIYKLLKEIKKKNKIIDAMADEILEEHQKVDVEKYDNITIWFDKKHILQYFNHKFNEKLMCRHLVVMHQNHICDE